MVPVSCCDARRMSSVTAHLRPSPIAATRSSRCIRPRRRSPRSPDSRLRFESDRQSKKADTHLGICFFGIYYTIWYNATQNTRALHSLNGRIKNITQDIVSSYRMNLKSNFLRNAFCKESLPDRLYLLPLATIILMLPIEILYLEYH